MCLATAREKERHGAGNNRGPEKGQTQAQESASTPPHRKSGVTAPFYNREH